MPFQLSSFNLTLEECVLKPIKYYKETFIQLLGSRVERKLDVSKNQYCCLSYRYLKKKRLTLKLGTQKAKADGSLEFKASLVYKS